MRFFKVLFVFWLLPLHPCMLFSQKKRGFEALALHPNSFYMVCRGTNEKMGFIAEKFNLRDKKITHVGIGVVENGRLTVYNVMNNEAGVSALLLQEVADFTAIPDIHYFSIWEYKASQAAVRQLREQLRTYTLQAIAFDLDFNENDDDRMYCSEFCAKVLLRFHPGLFRFELAAKKLDAFYSRILERDTLCYYAVDFFEADKRFCRVYEQYY